MGLRYRIYTFWKYEKYDETPLFCMIATFLIMVTVGIGFGLFALPIFLACVFNHWCWFLLWFITIPLSIGCFALLIDVLT